MPFVRQILPLLQGHKTKTVPESWNRLQLRRRLWQELGLRLDAAHFLDDLPDREIEEYFWIWEAESAFSADPQQNTIPDDGERAMLIAAGALPVPASDTSPSS